MKSGVRRPFYIVIVFISLFLGCLYGNRSLDIGIDYRGYVNLYYSIIDFSYLPTNIEIGYSFINLLFNYAGFSHVYFFSFLFAITTLLILSSVERKLLPFLFLVLTFLGYFLDASNILRHILAFSIFATSIKFILEKNFLLYCSLIIISSLIHKSAILLLPLYFILSKDYFVNRTRLLVALVVLFFFSSFIFNINNLLFLLKYTGYENYIWDFERLEFLTGLKDNRKLGFGFILLTLIDLIMVFVYSKDLKKLFPRFLPFYNLHIIGLGLSFNASGTILLSRINYYFLGFRFFTIAYLIFFLLMRRKKMDIIYFSFIMVVYSVAYYTRIMTIDSQYFPFKFLIYEDCFIASNEE